MAHLPSHDVFTYGQSIWYDNISRELIAKGDLSRLVSEWGVRGMTSNPTIFDGAMKKGDSYDGQVLSLKGKKLSTEEVFDELAIQDIAWAADIMLPLYRESNGTDGFVSLEVSPLLAKDAAETIKQAKSLNARLNRPNVMIKIPGTTECLPAIEACLREGISINVTLLFSVENYVEVAKTYVKALTLRSQDGNDISKIRSVASFFVSRVDTIVDTALDNVAAKDASVAAKATALKGKFGIANCKLAYEQFQHIFSESAFLELAKKGAAVQRPLWASTGTKNPAYRDTIYVEELIGKDTVNTMPHQTLAALVDHGKITGSTIDKGVTDAHQVKKDIESLGISTSSLMNELQEDGIKKFAESFVSLMASVEKKVSSL